MTAGTLTRTTTTEVAELVDMLAAGHRPGMHADGRYGLRSLITAEPMPVQAAVALVLVSDTRRAVALSGCRSWDLPEDIRAEVINAALLALPAAMDTAVAALTHAQTRAAELAAGTTVGDTAYNFGDADHDLAAVIDGVWRNLRAGRRMTGLPQTPWTS